MGVILSVCVISVRGHPRRAPLFRGIAGQWRLSTDRSGGWPEVPEGGHRLETKMMNNLKNCKIEWNQKCNWNWTL